MRARLIRLDCPRCQAQLAGDTQDRIFFCRGCAAGAVLGDSGLELIDAAALAPTSERQAELWRPLWAITADVAIEHRVDKPADTAEHESLPWHGSRSFQIPAFTIPIRDRTRLARALNQQERTETSLVDAPVFGGTLVRDDAIALCRHLVIGEEARKPDMLMRVSVKVTPTSWRLLALPLYRRGTRWHCAVTDQFVPTAT